MRDTRVPEHRKRDLGPGLPPDYGLWSDARKAAFHAERRRSMWPALRWFVVAMGAT